MKTTNIILNDNVFPLKSGKRQKCPLLPLLFHIGMQVPPGTERQKRKKRRSSRWEEENCQSVSWLEHVMIPHVESPRESTVTLLKPKDRFYKVTGHKPAQSNCGAMKPEDHCSWQESKDKPRQRVEKQRHYSANKGPYSQGCGLPSGCESWTVLKAERQRIDAFELWCWRRFPKVPGTARRSNLLILREINPEYSERTDAEAEVSVFWSSDANRWLTGNVPDAAKDWGQKEKRVSEDAMAGRHHPCNEHELGQTPGDGEGQGGLVCCSPWGCKESGMTESLKNNRWK